MPRCTAGCRRIRSLATNTCARARQADFLAAQVVEIADTVREGRKVRTSAKDGVTEERGDMVERSRLMVDARKWLAFVERTMPNVRRWPHAFQGTVGVDSA
jgi:hypothetical protein